MTQGHGDNMVNANPSMIQAMAVAAIA